MSKYDEVIECGPITIKRKGRSIIYKSNLSEDDNKDVKQKMIVDFPLIKQKMYNLLSEIETLILDHFNPLDALGYVTTENLIVNPEQYSEYESTNSQLEVEIVQNIILKNKYEYYRETSNYEYIKKLLEILDDFHNALRDYLLYDNYLDESLNPIEKKILYKTITNFLLIRGDAFPLHYKKISLELFSDSRLEGVLKKYGFTIEEYFKTIDEVERQKIAFMKDKATKSKERHDDFLKFAKENFEESDDLKTQIDEYISYIGEELLEQYQQDVMSIGSKESYKIIVNNRINENVLNLLSLTFGCNKHWTLPLDESKTDLKPIISIDGNYYCFLTPHLVRNVIPIIESLFSEKEFNNYAKIKGKYFAQKSFELLNNIFPTATIHENLYYPINEEEEDKDPEIDGIVSYNDNLLLVEIKAKKRRSIAGRKDILTVSKGDFKKNITDAFEQSKRALKYISSSDQVVFYDSNRKNQKEIMKIKKGDYNHIFLVNITLESFQEYSTSLNTVKLWDSELLCGNHYPFAVSIYDLLIITEILENSDDFIKYLIERVNLEQTREISSLDEIDFLGYFLNHGTLSKTSDLPPSKFTLIHGYSSGIEKYYSYLQGEIDHAEKPMRKKNPTEIIREKLETGRLSKNNRCWCGSNKKYKHCCGK
ncbi:SEC-C domain-containing protein [Methanolobus sp.]|uniref:SEC-C domain-containing protein n=1 Tax=Methanolobus sp. TaxID=1874737 RepID=UPI0025E6F0BB|nr:SEC-C domain-containing protein [Methanolobus sp.]